MSLFRDRLDAGRQLAGRLEEFAGQARTCVLGLPRGGVPVAREVARCLRLPLDLLVVRKLGVPGHEELAMGAIAAGGARVLNPEILKSFGVGGAALEAVTQLEQAELERRDRLYRGPGAPRAVAGCTVILVDDGIATGATMRAALAALRERRAARCVVASPVIAAEAYYILNHEADEVVAITIPEEFGSVGAWYRDFHQLTDEEIPALLRDARPGG